MNTIITQSNNWILNRLISEGIYKTEQAQEFLATGKASYFGETDKYFFKYVGDSIAAFKEVRLHKKSNRVTVSINKTKAPRKTGKEILKEQLKIVEAEKRLTPDQISRTNMYEHHKAIVAEAENRTILILESYT